ncbi:MAG: DUF2520 domain-containing protein [Muribaculaceae bacterium]|nr:DUF2520 domain-containing protein [Muribaculaceae bacterium]
MTIHVFNPEHDYALASFSPFYTPPAEVMDLRRAMAMYPLDYADTGDAILLLDSPHLPLPERKDITFLSLADLPEFIAANPNAVFQPWGWNPMIRHTLICAGVPPEMLPSEKWLEMLAALSHRRSTIEFNASLNDILADLNPPVPLPLEFTSVEEALQWEKTHHPVFFKAPWSSSGRGILYTDGLDSERHIRPWLRGIIRRQGSVMGESAADKVIDFATEWRISPHPPYVEYLGVSVFETSRRGKYHANIRATQERLMQIIQEKVPAFGFPFIAKMEEAIRRLLSKHTVPGEDDNANPAGGYAGYLGIDMMGCADGTIRPCVELNFRRTMGIPPARICIIGTGNVGSHLYKALSGSADAYHASDAPHATHAVHTSDAVHASDATPPLRIIRASGHADRFPEAEIYLICVKDGYVADVARRISAPDGAVVAHTAGAVSLDTLREAVSNPKAGCGVFYPLQTFSRDVDMHYRDIPILIEASDASALDTLRKLGHDIADYVTEADSSQRSKYHVAAALTCNFFNHFCTLADDYLRSEHLDLHLLLPLLRQTVDKLAHTPPSKAQTGPAVRGDSAVIEAHLKALGNFPDTARLYRLLSDAIMDYHKGDSGS